MSKSHCFSCEKSEYVTQVFCTNRTANRYKYCLLTVAASLHFSSEEKQNDAQVINYLCLYIIFPIIFNLIQLNYDSVG